ncbi:DUF2314 domain-containing protein [Novosphingobium sp.]|uniref:DUF2314 domain-containing protein n=1 Tax=Novosphingobium sp. TaxID=1874826 RepID=UPI001D785377|nr:DUF2314 domain-containing protein [Novosphingobium sp.]MBX9665503.1 DUF2314 domain-containing protein [Novosphingobium sp.]
MSAIFSGAIAALVVFCLYRFWVPTAGVAFDRNDPRLLAAKQEARAALPSFWTALEARDPADEDFSLKFNLLHGTGSANNESIWAGDIVRRDGQIFGRLLNRPVSPGFAEGDEVEIAPAAIDDWSFYRGGVAQGHFVTRVMIESAPTRIARQQKKALGWA